ncbi:hypothetical protein G9C85_11340 [Halorubellus sp. JP-L1]|uniref:hypothetical protein n=1 Tax=Halorubellus sp. JP-L1 TaxID=2715753 RepID=UPI00140C7431|nr:hypothetical protein [Halorubellus sp. JP-L1]NHN42214.1 hypothetical protein [Halorubellus sp. JP-L1]
MKLPRGDLVASRVVDDHADALADALDETLSGYVVLEPSATLLLGDDGAGVLTVRDGVPVLASHTGTGSGGASALADLAGPGPVQVEYRAVDADALAGVHDADGVDALAVPPGEPARVLAGDDALADRTRDRADPDHPGRDREADPLAAFLDDPERVEALREDARAEAERRAEEWGFADELS